MKVVVSGPAKARLRSHLQFILEVFDEGLAERTLKEILDGIEYLGEHPRSGQFEPYLEHLGQGHRRWVVGHYKLVYLSEFTSPLWREHARAWLLSVSIKHERGRSRQGSESPGCVSSGILAGGPRKP